MCGIGGILRFDGQPAAFEPERLQRMVHQLHHRGPDGQGVAMSGPCGLAHSRLAILDLAGGHQPMHAAQLGKHGRLTVVFNGEIYNHHDLRRELSAAGHVFSSDHSDTETLLHGYRQWGTGLPARLRGMFALALWDHDAHTLFLACDRVGKKPLWFDRRPEAFLFGSHPATILAGRQPGDHPLVNRSALLTFLRVGYTFHQSMIEGVQSLPAGHWMTINHAGQMQTQCYAPPSQACAKQPGMMDAKQALREAITQAVTLRLEADVPLGCFLSGGVDSSIVAAIAQEQLRASGSGPLLTFCARMPVASYDESTVARLTANHLGTRHHELVIDPQPDEQVVKDLSLLTRQSGEPMADSSLLATYWISQAAREQVKVVLSGDGGDELALGYDRYRAMRLLTRHRGWVSHLPATLLRSSNPKSRRVKLRRLIDASKYTSPAAQYQQMIHLFTLDQIQALGLAGEEMDADLPGWPAEGASPLAKAVQWDWDHYLPFDLLRKVDRASMAAALEVRCPLLDREVCDLARSWPASVLLADGRPKGILRQIVSDLVPPAISKLPKRGFAIPIGQWLATSLRPALEAHLTDGSLGWLGLDPAQAMRYLESHVAGREDHTHRLYALLSLSIWSKQMRGSVSA